MLIARTSSSEPVRLFLIPSLLEYNLGRSAFDPVVFEADPAVKNWKNGPLERVIEVLIGAITSSACFIVGDVCT